MEKEMKRTVFKSKAVISVALALILSFITVFLPSCIDTDYTNTPISDSTAQSQASQNATSDDSAAADSQTNESSKEDPPSSSQNVSDKAPTSIVKAPALDLSKIAPYSSEPFVTVNNNEPFFSEQEYTTAYFELYGALDKLGRCTTAYVNVCKDSMPTEERGSISSVKPSGWQSVKYDVVDGKYLYNRCHLIGWQLTAENANKQNLITGTRYLNVDGMLPFENMIADYVKETSNHVLLRVTPVFEANNLVASGVLMEARSIEDGGNGISFCVYCYNVQPGIDINYADGTSKLAGGSDVGGNGDQSSESGNASNTQEKEETYVLNTNTKKFHYPDCHSAKNISDKNKQTYTGTRSELVADGYSPCGNCKP